MIVDLSKIEVGRGSNYETNRQFIHTISHTKMTIVDVAVSFIVTTDDDMIAIPTKYLGEYPLRVLNSNTQPGAFDNTTLHIVGVDSQFVKRLIKLANAETFCQYLQQ